MAIEITPKVKVKIPAWSIILIIIDLFLVIILLSSYSYFLISLKKMTETLVKTPQEIFLEAEIAVREKELNLYKGKIDTFGKLLLKHQKTINIFDFLEKSCLPNVWFLDFDFSSEGVIVSGYTNDFVSLGQQILILKNDPLLKEVGLSDISLAKEGGVDFSLRLIFNPQIFTLSEIGKQ